MNNSYVKIDFFGISIDTMERKFNTVKDAIHYAVCNFITDFQIYIYDKDDNMISTLSIKR